MNNFEPIPCEAPLREPRCGRHTGGTSYHGECGGDVGVVEEVDAEGAGRLAGLVGLGGVRHHPGAFGPVESLRRINLLDRIVSHRRGIELALHDDPGMSGEG